MNMLVIFFILNYFISAPQGNEETDTDFTGFVEQYVCEF